MIEISVLFKNSRFKKLIFFVTFCVLNLTTFGQDSAAGFLQECEFGQKEYNDWQNFKIAFPEEVQGEKTANFEVTFIDAPANVQRKVQKAIDTWAALLVSKIPIRVMVTWSATLGNRTLASAGPTKIYRNSKEFPFKNTWFFVALAEALTERNLNDGDMDIEIKINSSINWYLGDATVIGGNQYDLETVILHEIAHAVGLSSSFSVADKEGTGSWGNDDKVNPSPYIYDYFINDSRGNQLVNPAFYKNNSTELKVPLTTSNIFFDFKKGDLIGKPLRIYAPITFTKGSSISHFDERSFQRNTPESLMTPAISASEVVRKPGEFLLNCLVNMGWKISTVANTAIKSNNTVIYPVPFDDLLTIQFVDVAKADLNRRVQVLDVLGNIVYQSKENLVENEHRIILSNLSIGQYILRIVDNQKTETFTIIK